MRLRLALTLFLLASSAAAAGLALDLSRRMGEARNLPAASSRLEIATTPHLIGLSAIAAGNLAALLVLVLALKEERTRVLVEASEQRPAGLPAPQPVPDALEEGRGGEPPAVEWAGGAIAAWKKEFASGFLELWSRATPSLYQSEPLSAAALEKFLDAPEFDAESSAVAQRPDGKLAGAILAMRYPAFEDDGFWWLESPGVVAAILVAPEQRRHGAGRALMKFAEQSAQRRRRPRLFAGGLENFPHLVPGIPEQDHATRVFFAALGYQEVRRTCHMEAALKGYEVPRDLVEREAALRAKGFSLDAAVPEDAKWFEAFLDRSTLERRVRRLEKFTTEPERFYLARFEDKIVGFIHVAALDEKKRSGINLIYFLREFRGAGLGSVLLVKAHELWRRMGAEGAVIWTYPEAAARFYPRAGFQTVQEWLCYGKDLPHTWDDPEWVKRWR